MSRGDPAGASRGGSSTARGKRVPEAKINVRIVQAKAEAKSIITGCVQTKFTYTSDRPFSYQNLQIAN
ncbi:hypothetical protein [Peribacillus frigoritolerans]|uniref:hypothetical protein n=1 Tax=Peribacillus frigoritolerans TaxID=450367 RepID=UPI0022818A75|nr:hypothetical protein [Peribacillus frigoritolerans]MCY9141079.1 hypothetical protein [Peribacillus frigoritolerans]